MTRHIGGSILPSNSPEVLRIKEGRHGTFETRPLPEIDTHALFFSRGAGAYAGVPVMIATHPNGHSVDHLAKRILLVWDGAAEPSAAMAQFEHIMNCGGLGMSRDRIQHIIDGTF